MTVSTRVRRGATIVSLHAMLVGTVAAQDGHTVPTYTKDVAPITQEKCEVCHQPNSVAPMSLIGYDNVRAYGGLIRHRVSERSMPPWHIDRTVGIQAFNMRSPLVLIRQRQPVLLYLAVEGGARDAE